MKFIFLAIPLTLAMLIGPILWLMGKALQTRPDTSSVWAAFFLGLFVATALFSVFHAFDWVNDLVAGRRVEKQNTANTVELSKQAKVMLDMLRSQALLGKSLPAPVPPRGGLSGEIVLDDPYNENLDNTLTEG